MLQAEVNGYTCRSSDNYKLLYSTLEDTTVDNSKSIEASNKRRLEKIIKAYDNLVCYDKLGNIVGVCVYTTELKGIELVHMYVLPKYRVSYGSALLNHYLINVIGDNKEILVKSDNISSFKKVVEKTKMLGIYTITNRARDGLKNMLDGKINWKEV